MRELTEETIQRIKDAIVCMVITALGVLGIVNSLLEGLGYDNRLWVFMVGIVLSIVWVIVLACTRKTTIIAMAVPLGLVVISLILWNWLYDGLCGIIDECIWDLTWYDNPWEDNWPIAIAMFTAVCVYFIGLNVVKIRSMVLAIVQIMPLLALFVTVASIPSIYTLVLCVIYVLGVGTLKRKEKNTHSAKVILTVSVVVSFICFIFINEYNYEQPKLFDEIYYLIDDIFEDSGLLGMGEGEGNKGEEGEGQGAGIAQGEGNTVFETSKMGSIDELKYEYEDVMTVTSINTGRLQYIPMYYGTKYFYYENMWSVSNRDKESTSDVQLMTKDLLHMVEDSSQLQEYVAKDVEAYKRNVICYQYEYMWMNGSGGDKGFLYEVNDSYFSKYQDISRTCIGVNENDRGIAHMNKYSAVSETIKNGGYSTLSGHLSSCISGLQDFDSTNVLFTVEGAITAIKRIKNYLSANYTYTLAPGKVPENEDFVQYFLTESKQGYCTYFASSAVLMFRELGIPARYVEGYVITPDQITKGEKIRRPDAWIEYTSEGTLSKEQAAYTFNVKDASAHAWVEIFMPGYGWVTVEVTPAYSLDGITGTQQEEYDQEEVYPDEKESEAESEEESVEESEEDTDSSESDKESDKSDDEKTGEGFSLWKFIKNRWWQIVVVCVAFIVAVMVAAHIIKRYRYMKRLRSNDIVAVYEMMERVLSELGYGRAINLSYEEYAKDLERREKIFEVHHFVKITDVALMVRFGGDSVSVPQDNIKMACKQLRGVREDLLNQLPVYKRILYTHFKIM